MGWMKGSIRERSITVAHRSVLLSSNYDAWPEAFNGQAYALLNVIQNIENADLLCPQAARYTSGRGINPRPDYLWRELSHRIQSQLLRSIGRHGLSNAQPVTVEHDYELFMFVCQFPSELTVLDRIKGWRQRCGQAVAYILESWPDRFPAQKRELKLLDHFDHVFVLNKESAPLLQAYTRTPVSFLASACDTLLSVPYPDPPERSIDVLSIGRRIPQLHESMVRLSANDHRFFYVHDTSKGGAITHWQQHRLHTANLIKRTKYFIAYDFGVDTKGVFKGMKKTALATRYFEGAAGGAVLLGSAQACPEFADYIDWDDAVIALPPETADVRGFLADLDAQAERIARIRTTNMSQCLRRHDWAHRWDQILQTLGLPRTEDLQRRLDWMASVAGLVEQPTTQRPMQVTRAIA
jgi:hypothetical protein